MTRGGYRPNSGRKLGSIPWNKGIPMSDESKKKVSLSKKGTLAWNKGKTMSDAMREKMRGNTNGSGNKGRTFSKETRKKMSLARKGTPSPMKGKKFSLEQRVKMSESRRKYLESINFKYSFEPRHILRRDRKETRRERIKTYGGLHSNGEWENLKEKYNFTCPSCKLREPEIKLTRDHIVSISNGGSDNIENIQPLCKSCNSKKATQTIKY